MKKKAIVINDVDDADSIMDDVRCPRFMVNAISEHTCAMSEKIDVPIICLDEDDDDDDDDDDDNLIKIDENYKIFLDHLSRDNNSSTRFVVDSGESDTRKFNIFSCCDSKRSKLVNENPMKNRVHQQSKRRKTVGFKAGRVNIIENIQRDNRVAERRKRRIAELEAARTSRAVPSLKSQQGVQQRDNIVRQIPESETLRAVPLLRTQEDIQRDNTVSQGRKRKNDELMADSLRRDVPLVRTEQDIQRDDRVAAETSKAVHVEPVNRDTELKDVDETSRSKQVFVETRKKNEGSEAVVDKDYMWYLAWLVDSLTDSTTKPMENLQNDQSDLDPPSLDTLKESTMVPEKDPLVKVKVEKDLEPWSDYIIEMGDSPFLDGECTPFVASKKMVDLDQGSKKDESSSCWFRKELMDVLGKPYDEGELTRLHHDASIHKRMTRCRELRKGRETDYETDELGQSYLESFPDFEKEYKLVDGVDKARALKLLRGFFFYLEYVSHDGAFKPWEKN